MKTVQALKCVEQQPIVVKTSYSSVIVEKIKRNWYDIKSIVRSRIPW